MNHLTVDPAFLTQLLSVKECVELRDGDGRTVGIFTPVVQPTELDAEKVRQLCDLEKARETLERERGQGRPLAEIWARLRAAETQK